MRKGFSDIKIRSASNRVRIEDLVEVFPLPNKKWVSFRFILADVLPNALHWLDIIGSKSKERVTIAKQCLGFDPETEKDHPQNCPYCKIGNRYSVTYFMNAIVRDKQEEAPRNPTPPSAQEAQTGYKDKESSSWTPVYVVRIPSSLAQKLQGLKDLNVHRNADGIKKGYDITHPLYGADVNIRYDKDASGTDKYQVQISDKTALTAEEEVYLTWNLDIELLKPESYSEAKTELLRMDILDQDGNHLQIDDDDDVVPSKGARKRKPVVAVTDDDDEDSEEEIAQALAQMSRKPAAAPKKGKVVTVDDDDDDEELPLPKKGKPPVVVEDEDEDDELPVVKKATKKAVVVEDDEDEDDELPVVVPKKGKPPVVVEDEDEDDELPVVKKVTKKAVVVEDAPKKVVKKKAVVVEEDEEDEPPVAKKKAKPILPPVSDDDFDLDDDD